MNRPPTIFIDTREQRPFRFSEGIASERRALKVGDYSLAGFEDDVVVERKELGDLMRSISHGRERFVKELRQLRAYRLAAIVIEADWSRILAGDYRAAVHPNAAVGSLMAFAIKYGVLPILAGDHRTPGVLCERLLMNFARIVREDAKRLAGSAAVDGRGEWGRVKGGGAARRRDAQ